MVQTCPVVEWSGFRMAFRHLWTQTIRKPDKNVRFSNGKSSFWCLWMVLTLRNPDMQFVRYLDESGIQVSGFRMVTVRTFDGKFFSSNRRYGDFYWSIFFPASSGRSLDAALTSLGRCYSCRRFLKMI